MSTKARKREIRKLKRAGKPVEPRVMRRKKRPDNRNMLLLASVLLGSQHLER